MKNLYYHSYNETLRNEYEQTGNVEDLEKYKKRFPLLKTFKMQ